MLYKETSSGKKILFLERDSESTLSFDFSDYTRRRCNVPTLTRGFDSHRLHCFATLGSFVVHALHKNTKRRSVLRSLIRSGAIVIISVMYFVYILQSTKDKSFYTGFSEDIKERLKDHNWHTVKATKSKAPYKLVWHCGFDDKKKALNFEKYLKSGSGFAFRNKHLI